MSFLHGQNTTAGRHFPPARAPLRRGTSGRDRDRLSRAERGSVLAAGAAAAGFCGYGFATGSPSTVGYVSAVVGIGAAIMWLRRDALPGLLAAGLAIAALATLAGGLVNVGRGVLYNAGAGPYSTTLRTYYLQYDHVAHAYVSFVAAFACWVMLAAPHTAGDRRGALVLLAVGTAVGLGALNEMTEFLATLAHHGAHAGGYWNTGWDLVCNFIGAGAAGVIIARPRGDHG